VSKRDRRLAVVASPAARDGHGSTLLKFVRTYGEQLQDYDIHATGGTHETLVRTGLFSPDRLKAHASGEAGGIVDVANLAFSDSFGAIAMLLDPTDPLAESPENLALQRACIKSGIPQLMNYGDLAHWIEYEADLEDSVAAPTLAQPGEEIVALIAHDGKKSGMLEFFAQNVAFLTLRHKELIATGTTGYLLRELCRNTMFARLGQHLDPDRRRVIEQDLGIRNHWDDWLDVMAPWRREWQVGPNDTTLVHETGRVVAFTLYRSGPDGGDVQIAKRILDGECNAVLFFHDPQKPHPHDADIRLCIRTCQLPDTKVTLRRDKGSAERWVRGCRLDKRAGLKTSGEERPGWPEQVLVLPRGPGEEEGQNDRHVRRLTRACAGYLDELLRELIAPGVRGRARRRVLLLLAWGPTVRWTIDALLDDNEIPGIGRYENQLLISPMIGLTGEGGNWRIEAPVIAHDLARIHGTERTVPPLASPAFFVTKPEQPLGPPGVVEIRDLIKRYLEDREAFVIALTALRPWPSGTSPSDSRGRRYQDIEAPDAHVELCGLFLDREGRPATPYWALPPGATGSREPVHTLMTFDLLKRIADAGRGRSREERRGEVIVICGHSKTRAQCLRSKIKAQIVNTLITDTMTRDMLRMDVAGGGPECVAE